MPSSNSALRIGIEATGLITTTQTGVQRYTTCFIKALYEQAVTRPGCQLTLYTHSGNPRASKQLLQAYRREMPQARFRDWPIPRGYRAALSLLTIIERPDVFHFPDPNWMRYPTCPILVTVHDLCWRKLPDSVGAGEKKNLQEINKILTQASAYIAVSGCTRADLAELVQELSISEKQTWVTYEGASENYHPTPEGAKQVRDRYQLGRYILCVSTYQHRKNLPALIRAFEKLVTQHGMEVDLVLVGSKGWGSAEVYRAAEKSPAAAHIRLLNYVPENDLPGLYSGAELFIFPSLYEGFGLPVLEAMACGAPVVVSNRSSLPEITQDAGLYFDPEREEEMTAAMLRVLTDPSLRQDMRARGVQQAQRFSWQKTAQATLDAYHTLVRANRGNRG